MSFWSKLKPPKSLKRFGEEVLKVGETVANVGKGIKSAAEEIKNIKDSSKGSGRSVAEEAFKQISEIGQNRTIATVVIVGLSLFLVMSLIKRRG